VGVRESFRERPTNKTIMKEYENSSSRSSESISGKNASGFEARTNYPVQRMGADLGAVKETASKVFNHDVRNVSIELNSSGPSQMKAIATAQGKTVKVAPSHSDLSKPANVKVLGHELKHTVQQSKGLVKPTGSIGGVKVNTEKRHEADADRGGEDLVRAL
jgi:hypothetical protein